MRSPARNWQWRSKGEVFEERQAGTIAYQEQKETQRNTIPLWNLVGECSDTKRLSSPPGRSSGQQWSKSVESSVESFLTKWNSCQSCHLSQFAKSHVVFRGSIPAEVLFVGEAPGRVEDILGKPFVGPSGSILSDIIDKLDIQSYVITNVVCCIPYSPQKKTREPSLEEALACQPHLIELFYLASPKLVVSLGEIARRSLVRLSKELKKTKKLHLPHPAYILRNGGIGSSLQRKAILDLQRALSACGIPHSHYYDQELIDD